MSADDELGFAAADALASRRFVGILQSADEQFHFISTASEDAPGGEEMLNGKNFGGSHKRDLATVFHGDDGGLEGNDGLTTADVALEEAIHGHGTLEISYDFGEDPFLGSGGLEGEDLFQGFPDLVFADTKRNGIFLPNSFTADRQAELVKKKLFEDETALSGGAKLIEGVE